MGETGWKDEQIFSKQQESLWMEGTTRAEPGGQRCVQAGVDSREHGGMVRGPRSRLPTFLSTCLLSAPLKERLDTTTQEERGLASFTHYFFSVAGP